MGWLCPRCGAENPFSVRRCRACSQKAGACSLVREALCAGAERLAWNGREAAQACMATDMPVPMEKANRFAQRCACMAAALFMAAGIWIGVHAVQASGAGGVPHRLPSAAQAAGVEMAGRALAPVPEALAWGEAALRQWDAARSGAGEGAGPPRQELEAMRQRAGGRAGAAADGVLKGCRRASAQTGRLLQRAAGGQPGKLTEKAPEALKRFMGWRPK